MSERLSDEDLDLEFARRVLNIGDKWQHQMHDPIVKAYVENCRRALAVLSKLTKAGS